MISSLKLMKSGRLTCRRLTRNEQRIISGLQKCSGSLAERAWFASGKEEKVEFVSPESLVGKRLRFRADFYSTRIMPPRDWTGMIEDERRSSSGQGITSYIVLLDEPFRSQEQDQRVDATEDEMEPF